MENKNKNTRRKLIPLCTLSMVFALLLFSPLYPVVSVDAAFSSIAITNVKPTEFSPGDTSKVVLTVKNNGGKDASDVRLSFQGTEIISPVGPKVVNINTLNSWCSKEVEITMHVKEEAPNGIYPIPVSCLWTEYHFDPKKGDVDVTARSAELGVYFSVIGEGMLNIGDVSTDPTDVKPGDMDVKITAFIENSGEAAAKGVEAKLICNSAEFKPSWSGTDRSYMGRLNSGDSKEAIFHVDVTENIDSKVYSIPLRIQYKDTSGREYEVMRELEILVEPKPEFEIVSYSTEPASISAGDTGVILHVMIRNVGSEKAESVSVRATGEAEVPFDFDVKSDYVGNLKMDEDWTAVLKFDVDKDASPKAYQQGIEIRCTGDRDLGDDNVYLFDKMIPISVSSGRTGSFSVPGFEAIFVLIALFVVLFLRRKK
uniref:Surface protein n=3 Tax=unclassified Candidatus Methanophaga TaxID=3386245 RepID=Q64B13_UNCAG|nr:surface protein [uncultured archaeon GZfos28B8]QNO57504.1 hypothetical protein PBOADKMI_00049 [Methanosarcinales archaeon ANME-1 ERB7]